VCIYNEIPFEKNLTYEIDVDEKSRGLDFLTKSMEASQGGKGEHHNR